MDCRTALELLELARPDSENLDDREFVTAAAHLEACPQCARQFRNLQDFDRKVGQVLRDVPVPAGLKEKLLEGLQADSFRAKQPARLERPSTDSTGNRRNQTSARSVSRRQYIRYSVSAVVCLMAGFAAWWVYQPEPNRLPLEQFRSRLHSTNYVLKALHKFDGNFKVTLPTDFSRSRGVSFTSPIRGLQMNRDGKHVMALYEFRFGGRGRSPQTGILMVIPLSSVEDPPEATNFGSGFMVSYNPVPNVAWTSKGLVYVCLLPGGDPRFFDMLLRALQSDFALTRVSNSFPSIASFSVHIVV